MSSGFIDSRIVQIHPTLRCNLACPHCYSSSSPSARGELDPQKLCDRLDRLRAEGYETVSFSGGEPLVYSGLFEVAEHARQLGFRVHAISNGLRINEARAARIAQTFDALGLSLDGNPERHDKMRGQPGAFERLQARLPLLREHGVRFGFAHCITAESIEDLPWLMEYAIEQGAKLLQLHPLTMVGRASETSDPLALSPADLSRVFLITELLRVQAEDRLHIQLDIVARQQAISGSCRYPVLGLERGEGTSMPLSELVNPIVIDEGGELWPLTYGMAQPQRIAGPDGASWDEAIASYKRAGAPMLDRLLRSAFADVRDREELFVDWYGTVTAHSHLLADASVRRRLPISA